MTSLLVTERTLRDRRVSLTWWVIGSAVYTAFIVAIWPVIDGNEDFQDLAESYPEALQAMFGGADAFAEFTTPDRVPEHLSLLDDSPVHRDWPLDGEHRLGGHRRRGGERGDGSAAVISRLEAFGGHGEGAGARIGRARSPSAAPGSGDRGLGPIVDLNVAWSGLVAATVGTVLFAVFHGLPGDVGRVDPRAEGLCHGRGLGCGDRWLPAQHRGQPRRPARLPPLRLAALSRHGRTIPSRTACPSTTSSSLGGAVILYVATLEAFERHDLS